MSTMRLTRGDTGNWQFTCVDADGVALDLTGAECLFAIRDDEYTQVVEKSIGDGLVDDGDGLLSLTVLPADTEELLPKTYHWGLKVTYDPEVIFTVDEGLFILKPSAVAA